MNLFFFAFLVLSHLSSSKYSLHYMRMKLGTGTDTFSQPPQQNRVLKKFFLFFNLSVSYFGIEGAYTIYACWSRWARKCSGVTFLWATWSAGTKVTTRALIGAVACHPSIGAIEAFRAKRAWIRPCICWDIDHWTSVKNIFITHSILSLPKK